MRVYLMTVSLALAAGMRDRRIEAVLTGLNPADYKQPGPAAKG
jgi:hypothetical protein